MDQVLKLLAVVALVLVNAVFVAAELSLVAVKPTRIDFLAEQGNRRARLAQRALAEPNRFISACQVGITLAGLGLGWLAEPAIATLINPLFERLFGDDPFISPTVVSFALAFFLVTIVLIVIGELVPKMIALQKSEQTILATAGFVNAMAVLFRPFIAILYVFTGWVLDLLGLEWQGERSIVYTEDELKMLVTASRRKGYLEQSEQEMIERAFEFADVDADQAMVPRTEMIAIAADASFDDVIEIVAKHGHSRYPVYGKDLDDIAGMLSTKELFHAINAADRSAFDLREIIKPALVVSAHTPLDELLAQMKRERTHSAIVADEHGGTAGMISLGDVLERIIGEVDDETHGTDIQVEPLPDGGYRLSGLLSVEEVSEQLGVAISEPYYNTIGGFVFGQLGHRPVIGDEIVRDGVLYRIASLDGMRIDRVDAIPVSGNHHPSHDEAEAAPGAGDEQS